MASEKAITIQKVKSLIYTCSDPRRRLAFAAAAFLFDDTYMFSIARELVRKGHIENTNSLGRQTLLVRACLPAT